MDVKDFIITQQKEQIQVLLQRVKVLEEEIARLKKDSSNSSKPPSSDIIKPAKLPRAIRRRRKQGGQPGHRKCSRQSFPPEQVDEVIQYELTAKDAKGLELLDEWHVVQQMTLPEKMYIVTEHRARKYRDPKTGQIVIAPLPESVQRGGLLGADVSTLAAFLKGDGRMSYSTLQRYFSQVMRLDLSRGLLCKAAQKVSGALRPAYDHLAGLLPHEPYLGIDETGHHDNGDLLWAWCLQTPAYSVFRIGDRSTDMLEMMLGRDYAGIIGCDYWGAYRKYARLFDVRMQYCMAHLIREIRFLAGLPLRPVARWSDQLLLWLKKLFHTLHRKAKYTACGFQRAMVRVREGFLRHMRRPPDHKLAQKLARRFRGQAADHYFRFMTEPGVEPTNNATEQAIRHPVIDRRITQGTRGDAGMRWCERIWTILSTCQKQRRNVFEFIHASLVAHWTNQRYPVLL
jgi:transposase